LLLEPGDVIASDGVFISGSALKCDESAATGETDAIKKGDNHDPFLLSGSKVSEGVGRYVVTAVGERSFFGKTMMGLRTESEDTPLQVKLDGLAERIAKLGAALAIVMFVTLLLKYVITILTTTGFGNETEKESGTEVASRLVKILISAITIVVVAVPEGLPLAVTLALAYATTRMLQDNNLVRVLSACETMGGATTICSDKTGTLTQNKMTVVKGVLGKNVMFEGDEEVKTLQDRLKALSDSPAADPSVPLSGGSGNKQEGPAPAILFNRVIEGIAINSSAFEGKDDITGEPVLIGSKTETALLQWASRAGVDFKAIRTSSAIQTVQIYPFSSEKKSMSTLVKVTDPTTGKSVYRIHVKGASEIILKDCDRIALLPYSPSPLAMENARKNGGDNPLSPGQPLSAIPSAGSRSNPAGPMIYPIDTKLQKDYSEIIRSFAEESLRTICLAYREFGTEEFDDIKSSVKEKILALKRAERAATRLERKNSDDEVLSAETPVDRPPALLTPVAQQPSTVSFLGVDSVNASETRSFDSRSPDDDDLSEADILSHPLTLAEIGKHLVCAALVGIEDPLRPGVPEAVEACKKAGIFVRMVTGDNVVTAKSIASKCGIYTRGGLVMEGSYFRQMGPEEMAEKLPRLQVLARSSPTDKQILVANLKALGETVAVTGDGTNDGPALKVRNYTFCGIRSIVCGLNSTLNFVFFFP
jgi:Ca2+-transporting ATPase